MDEKADELAAYLVDRLHSTPAQSRLLIGISGIPASGKSTFANLLLHKTSFLLSTSKYSAILVGQDGWHLTRAQLSSFPDPVLAHARRGIHWSFDADAYVAFIHSLRIPLPDVPCTPTSTTAPQNENTTLITAPTFSHASKDPVFSSLYIHAFHRLIILEGLYTSLSIQPWINASSQLDERWWIECDEDVAKRRLVRRHVESGIVSDAMEGDKRAVENDLPNGRFIIQNMLEPTLRIQSIDDPVIYTIDVDKGGNGEKAYTS